MDQTTVWSEPIWIKVNYSQFLLPQHQSTYLRGPEFQTSLHKIFKNSVNLVSQCSHLKVLLLSKFELEIDANSGPLWHVLWCCGSRIQEDCTFIQIGSGHTVDNAFSDLANWKVIIDNAHSAMVLILFFFLILGLFKSRSSQSGNGRTLDRRLALGSWFVGSRKIGKSRVETNQNSRN